MKKQKTTPQIIPVEQDYFPVDPSDMNKYLSKIRANVTKKIVFFGTPEFVIPILKSVDENFNLVAVVTGPDQIQGRKKVLTPTSVNLWAEKNAKQALVFTPQKLDEHFWQYLLQLEPDLFVVVAYGKIIPQNILDIPKFGAINIHPSLLPKYRGATPAQSAILNGDKVSGLTIIKMDAKMDHGPIVYQKEFELSDQDNNLTLHNKLFQHAAEVSTQIIKDFVAGKINVRVQNHATASFCTLVKKDAGYFDINNPPTPEILDRMIRAYFPWPTAWTKWKGKIIKFFPENKVQMEGKNKVSLKDFLRGYPDFPLKEI